MYSPARKWWQWTLTVIMLIAACLLPDTAAYATARAAGPPATVKPERAPTTSREARRESMREAKIPTSQQPSRQISTPAGRQLHYDVPKPGGGSRKMAVTNQTTDRVPGHGKHWEAGVVKIPERPDALGRSRVTNGKSKVNYGKQ